MEEEKQQHTNIVAKIWKVIYVPLMYMGFQIVVPVIVIFAFILISVIRMTLEGNVITDPALISQVAISFLEDNLLLLALLSALACMPLAYFIWSRDRKKLEKSTKQIKPLDILIIITIGFCTGIILEGLLIIISMFVDMTPYINSYKNLSNIFISSGIIIQILYIIIVGPLIEEIIFRGIVFNRLRRYGMKLWMAIGVQAVFFGVYHLNFYQGIIGVILGVILAIIYNKTKTLWVPIIVHMSYNAIVLIIAIFLQGKELSITIFSGVMITAVALMAVCARILYNRYKLVNTAQEETFIEKQ